MIIDTTHITASLILALAVSAIAMSMTQGSIFASFRTSVAAHSKWFGELVSCFFCLGHWVAAAAVVVFRPRPLRTEWIAADLIAAWFAIVALATLVSGLIFAVFLAAGRHRRERAMAQ